MTALLILLSLLSLAISLAFVLGAVKWTLRQVNVDDCCNWDDCL